MDRSVDPITLQVIKNALYSVTDEMSMALIRASYSPNIKDRRDCSAAMYAPDGELVAQTEIGTPIHLGAMPSAVENVLRVFPVESMEPGDHIIVNDPYPRGPGHLNDITCVSPVFHGDRIMALVANMAHHVDVGGLVPGSMPAGVSEIFQEGFQIPPVKIVRQGELDHDIMRLINQNVRTRLESRGDTMAQVAANNVGTRRLLEVIDRYDPDTIDFYMRALMDYSEARMRAGIRLLPKGKFYHEDFIEGTPLTKKMIKIAAAVEILDDSVVVDFSESDGQQPDSVNGTVVTCNAGVYYVFRCLVDPDIPPNSGAYRPFDIRVREGSVVAAKFPAPVCNSTIITSPKVVDVLLGALLEAFADRTQAASYGVTTILNIGGKLKDSDDMYSYVETYAGGQGAMADLDGMDAIQAHMTNTRNTPIEVIEASYPLLVRRYGLVEDSEGPGRRRGGVGLTREVTTLIPDTKLSVSTDRHDIRPWGAFGGLEAAPSRCFISEPDGTSAELPCTKHTTTMRAGETIGIVTPGGGGWGDPFEREPEKVLWDVIEGLVSVERAREVYGVAIDPSKMEIDQAATEKLRSAGREVVGSDAAGVR